MMYVDSVNCMTCERRHLYFSRYIEKYGHNYDGCGLTYELGIHLFQDRLIYMNNPFKYGFNNYKGEVHKIWAEG